MLTFSLAISCWTTSNLPWFMDLTFQVPMQYCSLQHQTLLLSTVAFTAGYCSCFGSIPSFFLKLFLHWSPVAYWRYWSPFLSIFHIHPFLFSRSHSASSGVGCWPPHRPASERGFLVIENFSSFRIPTLERVSISYLLFVFLYFVIPHLRYYALRTPWPVWKGKIIEYWSGLLFPSPVDHILSELSTMTHLSWAALHSMTYSFTDLDKAVVHVIRLVSFLWLWFSGCLPSDGEG